MTIRVARMATHTGTDGKLMNDFTGRVRPDERRPPEGTMRTLTVALDTAQYQLDMDYNAANPGSEDVYGTFNLIMRRKSKVLSQRLS